MRILHTADWHLGAQLQDIDRTEDFARFLEWLLDLMRGRAPDVLLVAGDVFDSTMPSTEAQRLYYQFLRDVSETPVRAVVITAGNHDSERFLRAARPILDAFRVFVAGGTPEEEAFILRNARGEPELGIAAVPFLREGDVSASGMDLGDLDRVDRWERGVLRRYEAVKALLREKGGEAMPLVCMGHLFVLGSWMNPGTATPEKTDRAEVFVGSLRNVPSWAFGEGWRYAALGHIHYPQKVKAPVPMRFSGSPLALHFGHRDYHHQVVMVELREDGGVDEEVIPVPQPRTLARVSGNLEEIARAMREVAPSVLTPVVEALCTERAADPYAVVASVEREAKAAGVKLAAVRVALERAGGPDDEDAPSRRLSDITPLEIFRDFLHAQGADEAQTARFEPLFEEAREKAEMEIREARSRDEAALSRAQRGEGGR